MNLLVRAGRDRTSTGSEARPCLKRLRLPFPPRSRSKLCSREGSNLHVHEGPPLLRRRCLPIPCTRADESVRGEGIEPSATCVSGESGFQAVTARTCWWSARLRARLPPVMELNHLGRLRRPASRAARRELLVPSGRIERPQPRFVISALGNHQRGCLFSGYGVALSMTGRLRSRFKSRRRHTQLVIRR